MPKSPSLCVGAREVKPSQSMRTCMFETHTRKTGHVALTHLSGDISMGKSRGETRPGMPLGIFINDDVRRLECTRPNLRTSNRQGHRSRLRASAASLNPDDFLPQADSYLTLQNSTAK